MPPPKIDGKAGHGDEDQNKHGFYNSGRCSASAPFLSEVRFNKTKESRQVREMIPINSL